MPTTLLERLEPADATGQLAVLALQPVDEVVEVFGCEAPPSGREEQGPFQLPDAEQVPPRPDCSEATRKVPPSRECMDANRAADVARRAAIDACNILIGLTSAQDDLRREYERHMTRFAALAATTAAALFVPLVGYAAAVVFAVAAIASLILAVRAALRARGLITQGQEAEHRFALTQMRFAELGVRVSQACCEWDRTIIEPVVCRHPPSWGGLARGRIGEPGG